MARRIRWFAPGVRVYEVVVKCSGDEMLMRPDSLAVLLIATALADACGRRRKVRLVAFCFVSNQFHLIVRIDDDADGRRISEFMKALDEQVAMKLNEHRGRHGHFFADRPSMTPILDEAHLMERMVYVHAQPVHHGLVDRVEEWPGLSSYRAVCDGASEVEATHFDEAAWRAAGEDRRELATFTRRVSVPVTMPAAWETLSASGVQAARRAVESGVREREREKAIERRARGEHRRLPKGSSYRKIDPFSRPTGSSTRKPAPWAHASAEAQRQYRAAYALMLAQYRVASEAFRATGVMGAFPEGTWLPWVREVPGLC
ncbi:MAG: hypothetical protein J0L92_36185 [Deltaproteobacteria bacterium]|nr:hypothetical protein [Deltaproteobacteria bacterium]